VLQLPDGQDIWVTVIALDHGTVRLGFETPKDVVILREEIVQYEGEETDGRQTP
jgi:carbon storage regulator CsrA